MEKHFFAHYSTIEHKTCCLYVRCSKEEQAKFGDTIEAQTEDLKAFAKEHKLKIYDIYVDEGFTARKKYDKRPAFMRMLQDVERHKFEYIIFTKLDRWFRNVADFYKIQEVLDKNNVTWLTALERYEMETTNGKLNVNIRLSVAQDEADRDSDRIKDVFRLKVKKGEAITGSMPTGLMIDSDKKIVIDPDNVQFVYDMFDYFEKTNSKRATHIYLTEKYNKYICYETISRGLRNTMYKGMYRDNANYCPAIIEPERFDRLSKMSKRNVRVRSTRRFYAFTGLLICKECNHFLAASTATYKCKEYTYYRCGLNKRGKFCIHSHNINEKKLENYLLENIKPELEKYIASFELNENLVVKRTEPDKIKAKMQRLRNLYINELIELEDYKKEYEYYKKELEDAVAATQKKDLSAARAFLKLDLQNIYGGLSNQEKRELWGSVINKIVIDNSNNMEFIFF